MQKALHQNPSYTLNLVWGFRLHTQIYFLYLLHLNKFHLDELVTLANF